MKLTYRLLVVLELVMFCTSVGNTQCDNPDDYTALRALYLATDGDNWDDNTEWPTEVEFNANLDPTGATDMSGWYGIECNNESNRVTAIELINNNLTGNIILLPGLDSLERIVLSDNDIRGGNWNFENPKLRVIAIGGNSRLKTTLPDFNLPLLEEIYTYGDSLSGPLPEWGNVPNLRDAYIYNNPYNDIIPDWELDSLRNLSLYNCGLTGDLPSLQNSTKLFSFYADDNGLVGEIPEYTDKTELDTLVLRNNNLSGCVDTERYCDIGWFTAENNPLLPFGGDTTMLCQELQQIGAACDDGDGSTINDLIQADCSCVGESDGEMRPFVTTWVTNNDGVTNSTSILVPTNISQTYNYEVDWNYVLGDPFVADTSGITGDFEYDFGEEGMVTIAIRGEFPRIYFNDVGDKDKIIRIDQWGDIKWLSMSRAFSGCSNLDGPISDNPDLTEVTNMSNIFRKASIFNQDISDWNTSNVTNMRSMFWNADSFNQDISDWDVSNVEDMSSIFWGADNFSSDIGDWDVSKVSDMSGMFAFANSFDQDIGEWDVSSVIDLSAMFQDNKIFNRDIGEWDVSSVEDMASMFRGAEMFNQDISGWITSNVDIMFAMFAETDAFNQNIGGWDVSNVTNMFAMFSGAIAFNQDISDWDVSNVEDMSAMFDEAFSFNQNLDKWNLQSTVRLSSNSSSIRGIFDNSGLTCENYSITLKGWAGNINTPDNLDMQALNMEFNEIGSQARTILESKNWTITGDEFLANCGIAPCTSSPICKSPIPFLINSAVSTDNPLSLNTVLKNEPEFCFSFERESIVDTLYFGCDDVCSVQEITVYNTETLDSCTIQILIENVGDACGFLNPDPLNFILSDFIYEGQDTIEVEVSVENMIDITEFRFEITYDNDVLDFIRADHLGNPDLVIVDFTGVDPNYVRFRSSDNRLEPYNYDQNEIIAILKFIPRLSSICSETEIRLDENPFLGDSALSCNQYLESVPIITQNSIISINQDLPIFSPSMPTICEGNELSIQIENSEVFSEIIWQDGQSTSEISLSLEVSQDYNVSLTYQNGCTLDTFITIMVNDPLSVEIIGSNLCDNAEQLLSVPSGFLEYNWQLNDLDIDQNNNEINIDQAGSYTITVTDNNGCTGTDEFIVINNTSPQIMAAITTYEVCASEGNTILDLSEFDLTTIDFITNSSVNVDDLNNLDFSNHPIGDFTFTFFTTNAIAPCENDSITINVTVSPCSDCVEGACLFDNPPLFIDLPNLTDIIISCKEDVPPPIEILYSNNQSGNCLEDGMIMSSRDESGYDGCSGSIVDTWLYTSQCGVTIDTSLTIIIEENQGTLEFENLPDAEVNITCSDISSLSISIDFMIVNGSECQFGGQTLPSIIDNTNNCGGEVILTWKVEQDCFDPITFIQTATISQVPEFSFTDLPQDITLSCDQIPYIPDSVWVMNDLTGDCEFIDGVQVITAPDNPNCPGTQVNTWAFTNPCTGDLMSHSQILTLVDCAAATLEKDYIEVRAGNIYDIDLFENDIVPDSLSTRITDIERKELFFANEYSTNGLFEFAISESFFDTIKITYEVCNLECDNCTTNNLQIVDEALKDIILTDIMTPNSDGRNDVLRFNFESEIEGSQLYIYNRWGDIIYEKLGYTNDWDANGYPGGVYFYVLKIGDATVKKTLTVVK